MRTKSVAPATPLSPELQTLLCEGPWSVGLDLRSMPPHNELAALWAVHGDVLTASMPRGQKPWFVRRLWFVRVLRGDE
jgi:hypothetical protein